LELGDDIPESYAALRGEKCTGIPSRTYERQTSFMESRILKTDIILISSNGN